MQTKHPFIGIGTNRDKCPSVQYMNSVAHQSATPVKAEMKHHSNQIMKDVTEQLS